MLFIVKHHHSLFFFLFLYNSNHWTTSLVNINAFIDVRGITLDIIYSTKQAMLAAQ